MKRLLHIECSPRKTRSVSKSVAEKFIEYYRLAHPDASITTLDPWSMILPEYDESTANAKYRVLHQEQFTPEEFDRWQQIEKLFAQFAAAELYLFSIPMWNFSIPYKLKHYIDLVTQPGLCFKVTDHGYQGLLTGRQAVVIYSSGGDYHEPPANMFDLQSRYVELWLRFIGLENIRTIHAGSTLADAQTRRDSIENAMEMAVSLASVC